MIGVNEFCSFRCDLVNFSYASSFGCFLANDVSSCFQGVEEGVEGAVSKFYFKQFLGFLDDLVAPHWLCLDEPQNEDVEECSVYALNNLFSRVFGQLFPVPVCPKQ